MMRQGLPAGSPCPVCRFDGEWRRFAHRVMFRELVLLWKITKNPLRFL